MTIRENETPQIKKPYALGTNRSSRGINSIRTEPGPAACFLFEADAILRPLPRRCRRTPGFAIGHRHRGRQTAACKCRCDPRTAPRPVGREVVRRCRRTAPAVFRVLPFHDLLTVVMSPQLTARMRFQYGIFRTCRRFEILKSREAMTLKSTGGADRIDLRRATGPAAGA
jgi:hypothetical protein